MTTTDGWRPIETAPKDGTLLLLAGVFDDEPMFDAEPTESLACTIGFNIADYTGKDQWEVAGWSWEDNCFTDRRGKPKYWQPIPAPPKESRP